MTTMSKCLTGLVAVLLAAVATLVVIGQGRAQDHAAKIDELNAQRIVALADADVEADARVAKLTEKIETLQAEMREQSAAHDAEASEFHMLTSAMRQQVVELQQVIEEANLEIRGREEYLAELLAEQNNLAAAYRDSLERMAAQDEMIQSYNGERALEAARQAELEAALEAALAQSQRYAEAYRELREQYLVLEAQLDDAKVVQDEPGVMPIDDRAAPAADDTPPLTGEVTAVESMGDELTLVEINLGSNDRVVEGMIFRVYRDEVYVSTIRIRTVDDAVAVGEVTQRSGTVEVGDVVRSGE